VWLVVGGSGGILLPHLLLFWFVTTAALALGRYLGEESSPLSPSLVCFYLLSAASYVVLVAKMAVAGMGSSNLHPNETCTR